MMCDLEQRCDEDQEKAREDIEELLDSSSSSSNHNTRKNEESTLPGRYVTKVVCVFPLEVSKRFVRPHATSDGHMPASAELIIHKLFGIQKLGNLLLLITPTATASRRIEKYIVHCYAVDTQWHLGVTSLTGSERDMIKNEQNPADYALIFCSSYIELEDAFMPTSIKSQLFDVLRKRSIDAIVIWYKGNRLSLQYWSSDPEQYLKEPTPGLSSILSRLQGRTAAGSEKRAGIFVKQRRAEKTAAATAALRQKKAQRSIDCVAHKQRRANAIRVNLEVAETRARRCLAPDQYSSKLQTRCQRKARDGDKQKHKIATVPTKLTQSMPHRSSSSSGSGNKG